MWCGGATWGDRSVCWVREEGVGDLRRRVGFFELCLRFRLCRWRAGLRGRR